MQKHSRNLILSTRMDLPAMGMKRINGYFFMSPAMTLSPSCSPGSLPRFGKDTRNFSQASEPHFFQTRSRTSNYIFRKPTRFFTVTSSTKRGLSSTAIETSARSHAVNRLRILYGRPKRLEGLGGGG